MTRRTSPALFACALLAVVCADPAWPQAGRTIRIVVPFPPGGSGDILARVLGEQIGKAQGATVVIENRSGGGASIAYEAVARAVPDGNTLVINANSMVINPLLRKVNYHPFTSYVPICQLVSVPQLIVTGGASPYRTMAEFVAAAKAMPGALTVAAVGQGTAQQIGFELFKRAANLDLTYVPYAGGAPAVTALLGGHVDAVLGNYTDTIENLNAGKLRALAAVTRSRLPTLADVPTVAELGYKDFEFEVWFGVVAPAQTPSGVTAQLATWFAAALEAPEVKPKLVNLGLYPTAVCQDAFTELLRKQSDDYARIIREANIKGE